jgi:hypothetical protein
MAVTPPRGRQKPSGGLLTGAQSRLPTQTHIAMPAEAGIHA